MDNSYEANHDILETSEQERAAMREASPHPKTATPEERTAHRRAAKHEYETTQPAHRTPRLDLEIAAAHLVMEKLNFKFLTDTANNNLSDWKTLYDLLVQERENCKDRIRSLTEFLGV